MAVRVLCVLQYIFTKPLQFSSSAVFVGWKSRNLIYLTKMAVTYRLISTNLQLISGSVFVLYKSVSTTTCLPARRRSRPRPFPLQFSFWSHMVFILAVPFHLVAFHWNMEITLLFLWSRVYIMPCVIFSLTLVLIFIW